MKAKNLAINNFVILTFTVTVLLYVVIYNDAIVTTNTYETFDHKSEFKQRDEKEILG